MAVMTSNLAITPDSRSTLTRPRWFRFSLRTFLLLFTWVSVALGMYVKRERDRYLAIETIKRWGGVVEFSKPPIPTLAQEYERMKITMRAYQEGKPRPEFPDNLPQGKSWLRGMFGRYGKYHGGDVDRVLLSDNAFTPAGVTFDIGVISAIPEVKTLLLGDVNPAAMSKLRKLPRLESLKGVAAVYHRA
jgi:hypothetical protein